MPPPPPRPVTVAVAATRDVARYLDEIGNCAAFESVTIQPQISGPIAQVHFEDGAQVKKGDLLFTIDPRPYDATLARAQATLQQDRAKADYAEAQFRRNRELKRTKVIASQELESTQSDAEAAQAQVLADQAAVQAAQIDLDYCFIRSPIDGRASKRAVDVGNVVSPGTSLLLIQRQDPIYVNFTVPEGELPKVRKFIEAGTLRVEARFPDDPEKSRVGRFDFLDSGVQESSGTVRMRAVLDNDDRLFWPGQFVEVRVLLETLENAVLLPAECFQIGSQGAFVFVVKEDSTVEMRPVRAGQRHGDETVIESGLRAGEKVVKTGQLAIAPGAKVAVVEEEPPPAMANEKGS